MVVGARAVRSVCTIGSRGEKGWEEMEVECSNAESVWSNANSCLEGVVFLRCHFDMQSSITVGHFADRDIGVRVTDQGLDESNDSSSAQKAGPTGGPCCGETSTPHVLLHTFGPQK